jgi:NAD+ diphosphatase
MREDQTIDHDKHAARNTFAEFALDRASRRRRDESWVRERSRDPMTRFVPIWESKVLVTNESRPRPILLSPEDSERARQQAESIVLLGESEERAYFAVSLMDPDKFPPRLSERGEFRPLRAVAALLEWREAALLAYAKAMIYWHRRHRFCGDCGSATTSTHGGHLRVCTNEECGRHHFPRIDPAIIVRVTHGGRCLLGRQPTWPEELYSIIAGFVEPGENLEAAVAREVREETGIRITRIRYHSSQPWPFPSSLMLGFTAEATITTIRLHDGELEDAQWVSREDIVRRLRQGTLQLPSEISISHRLIADWFDAGQSGWLKHMERSG